MTLLTMFKFLFFMGFLIIFDDKGTTFGAKNFATKPAVVLPTEKGDELFITAETAGDVLIRHPVLPGTDQLTYDRFIIHYYRGGTSTECQSGL